MSKIIAIVKSVVHWIKLLLLTVAYLVRVQSRILAPLPRSSSLLVHPVRQPDGQVICVQDQLEI